MTNLSEDMTGDIILLLMATIKHLQSFGALFKKFRLKAELSTLSEFGEALAHKGFIYEDSILSRWQQGNRIPSNRSLLLTIIKIFIERGGIASLKEANMFLWSSGHGYLTETELQNLTESSILSSKLQPPRKIVEFLTMIGKSKKILRSGWVREKIKDPESVAGHSFQLSVLAMVLADQLGVDKEKLIKMALVRGLGELVTGDIVVERGNIIDIKKKGEKEQKEREGIKKIFGKIGQVNEYLEIFDEMITKDTLEARVFWDFDNLEMAFQALEYEREQGKVVKPTRETVEKIIKALDLSEQEKGEFLLVGGYLPTEEEIKKVVKEVRPKFDIWHYPAYMMDFST